jgi:hypothetical protein
LITINKLLMLDFAPRGEANILTDDHHNNAVNG